MKFVDELQNYLKARYPLILIKSTEEDRLTMDLKLVAKILGHDLITWSIASGLKSDNKQVDGRADSASVSSATTSNSNDSLGGRRIDLI